MPKYAMKKETKMQNDEKENQNKEMELDALEHKEMPPAQPTHQKVDEQIDDSDIDIDAVTLSADFATEAGVEDDDDDDESDAVIKKATGKWICFSPLKEHCVAVGTIEVGDNKDHYIITPNLQKESDLDGEWKPKHLYLYQTKDGVYGFWPVKLPDEDGDIDTYNKSMRDIVAKNSGKWVRVKAVKKHQKYKARISVNNPPPDFAKIDGKMFKEFFKQAITGKLINSMDHRVIRNILEDDGEE